MFSPPKQSNFFNFTSFTRGLPCIFLFPTSNNNLIDKIPLTSPYSENPRKISSVPANIVDWVLVELRETINGSAISSKSFLLRNDGKIVEDDGITENLSLNAPQGLYYIVIKHRNHISIMSSTALELNNTSSTLHDFTKN